MPCRGFVPLDPMSFSFSTTQFLGRFPGYSPLEADIASSPVTLVNSQSRSSRDSGTLLLAGGITVTLMGMA
jgi:hypothetical protein